MLDKFKTQQDKQAILLYLFNHFLSNHQSKIVIGAELEFYLINVKDNLCDLINDLNCQIKGLAVIEAEEGINQYEFKFQHLINDISLVNNIILCKKILTEFFYKYGVEANFSAKPYLDQPGSSLQYHVNLLDMHDNNIFAQPDSQMLSYSIGGICQTMAETMIYLAPNEADYLRYDNFMHAPSTISWGANNRTTALRLPVNNQYKRIEHRVASASCDPYQVIIVILLAIDHGIKHKIKPPTQIYGNAKLDIYNLTKLPLTLKQAKAKYDKIQTIKKLIANLINDCFVN